MRIVNVVLGALCCLTLLSCSKDASIQTGKDILGTQYPMTKQGPPDIPQVEGIWGPCWSHAGQLHANVPYFSGEVARLSEDFDRDPQSSNLREWIRVGKDAGFTFFLYQFPSEWINNISRSWAREFITNRIQAVHALMSAGQSCAVEIDDLDDIAKYGYTANQIDSLRMIIQSLNYNDPIYGTVSEDCSLLNHVDVIMTDAYKKQNRTSFYQQLQQTYQKPLKIWISIEINEWWAQDACAIRDQLEDARGYATSLWVFADKDGTDEITNHQFDLFLSALQMSHRCF